MNILDKWENFYLIVGGAAGALIGLQFVVVTLIADKPALRLAEAGAAFATPTIVHFTTVLALSAIGSAPWQSLAAFSIIWGLVGVLGIVYVARVIHHLRVQTVYQPEAEDWLLNAVLPLLSYLGLLAAAVTLLTHTQIALFTIGASMLMLLLIGIHNAWDAIVYHVFGQTQAEKMPKPKEVKREAS